MIKTLNHSIRYIMIIVLVLIITNISNNVFETKVENDNVNKSINLSTMALKVEEYNKSVLFDAKDTYTGDLTGYAHNCPMCSGKLGCLPNYDITNGTTKYPDATYGEVYIVASSKNLACGSIVTFNSPKISSEPVVAIVLDRGVRGNALDILVANESIAVNNIGRSSISYDVLRSGWE